MPSSAWRTGGASRDGGGGGLGRLLDSATCIPGMPFLILGVTGGGIQFQPSGFFSLDECLTVLGAWCVRLPGVFLGPRGYPWGVKFNSPTTWFQCQPPWAVFLGVRQLFVLFS